MTSLDEHKYFFDSLRQTSEAPKRGRKVKEGIIVWTHSVFMCRSIFTFIIQVLFPTSQPGQCSLPGDVQEEAVV